MSWRKQSKLIVKFVIKEFQREPIGQQLKPWFSAEKPSGDPTPTKSTSQYHQNLNHQNKLVTQNHFAFSIILSFISQIVVFPSRTGLIARDLNVKRKNLAKAPHLNHKIQFSNSLPKAIHVHAFIVSLFELMSLTELPRKNAIKLTF